jgi:hypothetical protein
MIAAPIRALFPEPPRRFRLTAPEPIERDIHEACAQALERLLAPPAVWFTYPAGASQLSPQQMARHSRIGLKRGLPDLWILHHGVYCIELKRRGGRLSKTRVVRTRRGSPRILDGQSDVFPQLLASGGVADIAICHSVDEMLAQLARWHIPLRCFT